MQLSVFPPYSHRSFLRFSQASQSKPCCVPALLQDSSSHRARLGSLCDIPVPSSWSLLEFPASGVRLVEKPPLGTIAGLQSSLLPMSHPLLAKSVVLCDCSLQLQLFVPWLLAPEMLGWQSAHSALKANHKHAPCSAAAAVLLSSQQCSAGILLKAQLCNCLHDPLPSNITMQQLLEREYTAESNTAQTGIYHLSTSPNASRDT